MNTVAVGKTRSGKTARSPVPSALTKMRPTPSSPESATSHAVSNPDPKPHRAAVTGEYMIPKKIEREEEALKSPPEPGWVVSAGTGKEEARLALMNAICKMTAQLSFGDRCREVGIAPHSSVDVRKS